MGLRRVIPIYPRIESPELRQISPIMNLTEDGNLKWHFPRPRRVKPQDEACIKKKPNKINDKKETSRFISVVNGLSPRHSTRVYILVKFLCYYVTRASILFPKRNHYV